MYRFILALGLLALASCDSHEWDGPEGTKRIFQPHGDHGDDHADHGDAHDDSKDHAVHDEADDSHQNHDEHAPKKDAHH